MSHTDSERTAIAPALSRRYGRIKDFANVLGCSDSHAKRIVDRGDIAVIRMSPKVLLIPIDAIEDYVANLEARRTKPVDISAGKQSLSAPTRVGRKRKR